MNGNRVLTLLNLAIFSETAKSVKPKKHTFELRNSFFLKPVKNRLEKNTGRMMKLQQNKINSNKSLLYKENGNVEKSLKHFLRLLICSTSFILK